MERVYLCPTQNSFGPCLLSECGTKFYFTKIVLSKMNKGGRTGLGKIPDGDPPRA